MIINVQKNKHAKIWLYARVSRDEEMKGDSIENQINMLEDYAKLNNLNVIGKSFDNNITGTNFDREGIDILDRAITEKQVDVVLIKDFSRLGRNHIETSIYIASLKLKNIEVYSITESISSLNEDNKMLIAIKNVMNEGVSTDLSRKIRTGFEQKQKNKGVVIIPPFGYIKDKLNDNKIIIMEECAEIIRLIFEKYKSGEGARKIAMWLNDNGYKTPSYYQEQIYNKQISRNRTKLAHEYLWYPESVTRILKNEAYIGTLINHKTSKDINTKKQKLNDKSVYIKHENYYNPIVSMEDWKAVQAMLNNRNNNNVRATSNEKIHRYSGLIRCKECNAILSAKKRKSVNGDYVEYKCNNYVKRGVSYCSSHKIKEDQLDELLYIYLKQILSVAEDNMRNIDKLIVKWNKDNNSYKDAIKRFDEEINNLRNENKMLIKKSLKLQSLNEKYFDEMIKENDDKINILNKQKERIESNKNIKSELKKTIFSSVDILTDIIKNRTMTNSQINLFVKKILISEENKNLSVEFEVDTCFSYHFELQKLVSEVTLS